MTNPFGKWQVAGEEDCCGWDCCDGTPADHYLVVFSGITEGSCGSCSTFNDPSGFLLDPWFYDDIYKRCYYKYDLAASVCDVEYVVAIIELTRAEVYVAGNDPNSGKADWASDIEVYPTIPCDMDGLVMPFFFYLLPWICDASSSQATMTAVYD